MFDRIGVVQLLATYRDAHDVTATPRTVTIDAGDYETAWERAHAEVPAGGEAGGGEAVHDQSQPNLA
jgi:hypothetical protein